ncbi:MFS transporter [Acidocella aromatica]|uniref:SHS family lactate transporter-like MFS transporter n=1 Tax=Acidocella aromatica TaxID=1303579 RepID=A0A840VPS9_9PROT|nr:MFS transporter [Acidocella aromatica]MBB5372302.1 SHS family lactate transporter-like MFS transporter [Acidocella aromatica]
MTRTAAGEITRARNAVIAAYLGWTLDAFDFFILIFTFDDVAKTFGVSVGSSSLAIMLTLATRAVGAFVFGRLADRFGRKPVLMLVILLYSLFEAASGLAWSFSSFLIIRALFGIAMGGEWGVGSSLAMESIPIRWRGWVSGLLQAGYPSGYFLATLLFGFAYHYLGWQGMFFAGAAPALLVFFINNKVEESPAFTVLHQGPRVPAWRLLAKNYKLAIYCVLMMTAFNFFSHGTQDIYPKLFLGQQMRFTHAQVTDIVLVYNVGAALGGILFGLLSERIGRRYAITAACALSLVVLYFWAHAGTAVEIGLAAFVMQLAVQGAWGVVPAHLNELSPAEIRGTFPGVVYQLGNFIASSNAPLQIALAGWHGGDYGFALTMVAGGVAVVLMLLMLFGPEARDVSMTQRSKL